MEQQHWPGWDVGVVGCEAFPLVRPVLGAVGRLDAGFCEELPNEFTAFGAVVMQGFVGPFAGDQDAAAGDAQVVGLVGLALAPSRGHGVPGAVGLDAIEQPHRAPRRARCDLQFCMQPSGMIALPVGGGVIEASRLPDTFSEVLRDALTAYY